MREKRGREGGANPAMWLLILKGWQRDDHHAGRAVEFLLRRDSDETLNEDNHRPCGGLARLEPLALVGLFTAAVKEIWMVDDKAQRILSDRLSPPYGGVGSACYN